MHKPYLMFERFRNNAKYFVETGTHLGDAVAAAKELGYEKCYSVEYHFPLYSDAVERFKEDNSIKILLGSGEEELEKILPEIDERCLFYLDAHDTFGTGGGVPTHKELEVIEKHHIKNHTIIIDDVPIYFGDGTDLANRLLKINPNYIIERVNPHIDDPQYEDYDMVAYINE
jgi:hypothetical protein